MTAWNRTATAARRAFFAAALALAVPIGAEAQSFAPAAVVNGEIITNYDVEQRALLLTVAAGGASPNDAARRAALEVLIEDAIKLQTAARFGVEVDDATLVEALGVIGSQNGMSAEGLVSGLAATGVERATLERQVKAQIVWNGLIQSRYGERAAATDAEAAVRAASPVAPAPAPIPAAPVVVMPTEPTYLMAELLIADDGRGEGALRQRVVEVMQALAAGQRFSEIARAQSAAASAAAGGDMGWVPRSALAPLALAVVSQMQVGQVAPPQRAPEGYYIYGLRDIRLPEGDARYRFTQIVLALSPNASESEVARKQAEAEALRPTLYSCDQAISMRYQYAPQSGAMGEMSLSEMPGPIREAVVSLGAGQTSAPVRSSEGLHLIVICDKTPGVPEPIPTAEPAPAAPQPQRQAIRTADALTNARLERFSRSLMQELRRDSVIEYR